MRGPAAGGSGGPRGTAGGNRGRAGPVGPAGPGRPVIELRPGIPWTAGIDRAAWRRAWRSAGAEAPTATTEPQGSAALRTALTGYLWRSRAVRCGPGQIMVTRGVAGSLGLIAAALLRPGDKVGVEEPGYPTARAVFAAHGAQLVPCPVDADGLVVDALPAGLRLVYTTPAHQYPLGGRLPVPRRQALIAWARSTGALIVEDDYDGEFRYDVGPLPALFGLDPGVVVYLGTTTKILTPALRVGWLVAGPELVARLADVAAGLGEWAGGPGPAGGPQPDRDRRSGAAHPPDAARIRPPPGGDDRRARRRGRGGRPAGRLLGDEAGMHMVLRTGRDAEEIAAAAWERGVAVATLARYFAGPVTSERAGARLRRRQRRRDHPGLPARMAWPATRRAGHDAAWPGHVSTAAEEGADAGRRRSRWRARPSAWIMQGTAGDTDRSKGGMADVGVPGVENTAGWRMAGDNGLPGGDGHLTVAADRWRAVQPDLPAGVPRSR